jgi:hypothetical protein
MEDGGRLILKEIGDNIDLILIKCNRWKNMDMIFIMEWIQLMVLMNN